PPVIVEIIGHSCNRVARTGLQNSGFFRHVCKCAITIVMKEHIGVTRQAPRTTHHGNAFPLAGRSFSLGPRLLKIELDVIADEQVQVSIAIVIEPRAPCTPAHLWIVDAGLARYVGKSPVAVVMEQDVVSPEAAEEVIPAVVVVITNANTRLPAG